MMKNKILNKIYLLSILICSINFYSVCQEKPTFQAGHDPKPEGKKWVLIENLSDEFDGETLDETKWKNTDPNRWIGRAPGIFKKDVARVSDGILKLTVYQLPSPEIINNKTWTHAGGYIGSRNAAQVGTYFEARMKASKTFMSSTFWLINNRSDGNGCDVRVTELDIQECIGQVTTDKAWAQNKYREMGSNTHSRNTVCPETPAGSKGNRIDIGAPAYDDYHVYAAWWKSASEILFFLDGKHIYTVEPEADFNLPMYLRMVSEIYDWNPAPIDGGMNGTKEERTSSYDWVRTWKLENVSTSNTEDKMKKKLVIYSNPVKNRIKLSNLKNGFFEASILNLHGEIVKEYQKKINQTADFNISDLEKGIYFIIIQNEGLNHVVRFIKI